MRGITLFLFIACTLGATGQTEQWHKTFGGSDNDAALSVLQCSDGGYLLVGYTYSFKGGPIAHNSGYLIRVDGSGEVEWERPIGGRYDTKLNRAFETEDGYLLFGSSRASSDSAYAVAYVAQVDRGGNLLSESAHDNMPVVTNHSLHDIIQTRDSGFAFVTFGNWLYRYSKAGQFLWRHHYSASRFLSLIETRDDGFLLAGYTNAPPAIGTDMWVIKTNATGDSLWSRNIGTSKNEEGMLIRETDSGLMLVGYNYTDNEIYLANLSPTGLYQSTKNIPGYLWPHQIREFNGSLLVVGSNNSSGKSVLVKKVTTAGDDIWGDTFSIGQYSSGYDIQPTSDGGYVIAGITENIFNATRYSNALLLKLGSEPLSVETRESAHYLNLW